MTISAGDSIPDATLTKPGENGPEGVTTEDLFKGKKVVMFGLPGAFTPTCSASHLPGFINNIDALKAKGVDNVYCISVNDAFVMGAWGKDQGAGGKVTMIADGDAAFAKAAGLEFDLTGKGMGLRMQRFALVANDGKVESIVIDEPGTFEKTAAEAVLETL